MKQPTAKRDYIRHVLVVEDDHELAELLSNVLTYENCVVDIAPNGKDALDHLQLFEYEAVVCDLMMPRMDGEKLYEKVIADYPHLTKKFLFITGEARRHTEMTELIYRSKCPLLEKPFKMEQLTAMLRDMFDQS